MSSAPAGSETAEASKAEEQGTGLARTPVNALELRAGVAQVLLESGRGLKSSVAMHLGSGQLIVG